jgi:hypothetical protein
VPSDCHRPTQSASDQPHGVAFSSTLSRDTTEFYKEDLLKLGSDILCLAQGYLDGPAGPAQIKLISKYSEHTYLVSKIEPEAEAKPDIDE